MRRSQPYFHPVSGRRPSAPSIALALALLVSLAAPLSVSTAAPATAQGASAAIEDHLRGLRQQLERGHPDRVIAGARELLGHVALGEKERRALLSLIAEAEYTRASARHFDDIASAVRAAETLLKALPEKSREAAEWRWRLAWMHWKHGDLKRAAIACRAILSRDQADADRRRALLLLARIHLAQGQTGEARRQLLQHGLLVADGSREQAEGMAWMAVADFRERRFGPALARMEEVARRWPRVVHGDPDLNAAWVLLLGRKDARRAIREARDFLTRYIDRPQAARVRLLLADLLAAKPDAAARKEARRLYALLASEHAETPTGIKAFMRGMMLDADAIKNDADENNAAKLRGMMRALEKIAAENQLSPIEDEAMLDLGILGQRLESLASEPPADSRALAAYARAFASSDSAIARKAKARASRWLARLIDAHLKAGDDLAAVSLWRRWPQFRPAVHDAPELHLRMARAMRGLMLFDASERILIALQREAGESVRGQRVMIERARLWLDRNDADGVEKIMRWLNDHPLTLFAPELRLIAARIHLQRRRLQEARQMLLAIDPADLALDLRAEYWRARAETAEGMARWHDAARAWRRYRKQPGADDRLGLWREARALFEDAQYAEVLTRLNELPEDARDQEWSYRAGVCELKSGDAATGRKRLQALAASDVQAAEGEAGASPWPLLARLALADASAQSLIARARESAR